MKTNLMNWSVIYEKQYLSVESHKIKTQKIRLMIQTKMSKSLTLN